MVVASRQGGPGTDEGLGAGTTDRRSAPYATPSDTGGRSDPSTPPSRFDPDGTLRRGSASDPEPSSVPAARRRTPEDPPVRDPGLYALTDHFRERLEQPGRYVSTGTVSDAIRRGQLRWNRTDGWRFALVKDGIRVVVVVGDTETNSPVVVTGWTEVADREDAVEAARFDPVDIDTIAVRTGLSEDSAEPIPDRIRPRTVTRPFVVGEHRLETAPGEPFVRCVDCGCRFRSKSAITSQNCHGGRRGR